MVKVLVEPADEVADPALELLLPEAFRAAE
jgi:hypothetical protein